MASPADMELTGVDLDNNVCFSIQSSGAWLQQHDIVRYPKTLNSCLLLLIEL